MVHLSQQDSRPKRPYAPEKHTKSSAFQPTQGTSCGPAGTTSSTLRLGTRCAVQQLVASCGNQHRCTSHASPLRNVGLARRRARPMCMRGLEGVGDPTPQPLSLVRHQYRRTAPRPHPLQAWLMSSIGGMAPTAGCATRPLLAGEHGGAPRGVPGCSLVRTAPLPSNTA